MSSLPSETISSLRGTLVFLCDALEQDFGESILDDIRVVELGDGDEEAGRADFVDQVGWTERSLT